MFCTLGDVIEYMDVFSTLTGIMSTPMGVQCSSGYHDEYGGYPEYIRGIQHSGGYHEYTVGYHDECRGIMSTPGDVQNTGFLYKFSYFLNDLPPHLS